MSITRTKEGIEVKPGQIWRDLDKRMHGRLRSVVAVVDGKAVMCNVGTSRQQLGRVSVLRMHKASTGWQLVSEAP